MVIVVDVSNGNADDGDGGDAIDADDWALHSRVCGDDEWAISVHSRVCGDAEWAIGEDAEQLVRQERLEGETMGHLVHGQREAMVEDATDGPGHQEKYWPRSTPHLVGQKHLDVMIISVVVVSDTTAAGANACKPGAQMRRRFCTWLPGHGPSAL